MRSSNTRRGKPSLPGSRTRGSHWAPTPEIDFLQGGLGKDSLYAGADPVWMIGGPGSGARTPTYGHDTFYITPSNYTYFYNRITSKATTSANRHIDVHG